MIKEICNKLRDKRKELGYSIEYVVEKTKLYPSMIRDIEEGNLTTLNPTYLKGFVKIYAAFLKVDAGGALNDLGRLEPLGKDKLKLKKIRGNNILEGIGRMIKQIPPEVKRKIFLILAGIILLWGFLALGSFLIRKVSLIFTASPKAAGKPEEELAPTTPLTEELVATLIVKKNCFLKVRVDGEILFEGVLKKGARETWQGEKEIALMIRDGSAIALEVNGRAIPTLSSLRKPIKSLKITPSGIVVDK
ncbi:MAG: RodZ domain-containing protein [Candidatus Omnitrophota bacterium]